MGGARCSYRTCTTKSDKKTHLFHFPVFDKIRCHQWITNAQKLNFLDLKLSQLKNRMICEHHFTEECFMNVTRGKLKNTAVPTEDGPFCIKRGLHLDDREIPIILDDIENDYLHNMERKAHYSVKYGDFLTNDVTEPIQTNLKQIQTVNPNSITTSIRLQDTGMIFKRRSNRINFGKLQSTPWNRAENHANDIKDIHIAATEKNSIRNSVSTLYQSKPLPKVLAIELEELNLTEKCNKSSEALAQTLPDQNVSHNVETSFIPAIPSEPLVQFTTLPSNKHKQNITPLPSNKKVKILSEKKICEPVKVSGELQTVSPSALIKVPDKKKKPNVEMNGTEIETFYIEVINPEHTGNIQGSDHSGIVSAQPVVINQMYNLNECNNNTTSLISQFEGHDKVQVLNELFTDDKPAEIDYVKQDPEVPERFTGIQHVSTVPELLPVNSEHVELISTSTNEPPIYIQSSDVPEEPMLFTDSTYVHNLPTDIQNASGTLSGVSANTKHASGVSINTQNNSIMHKNVSLNKKLPTLLSSPSKSILKSKMTPEKLAAIREKRKFNMKIRDLLDSCLNKLDEDPDESKSSAAMKNKLGDKKVGQHLSEDPNLPTSQENTIAYLEARLQRMEDTLLNKIEQNSQRITDLKRALKPSSRKKSAYTQTSLNAETIKKHLYQQISQFLSPEATGTIYEELFMSSSKVQSHKKRKKR